MAVSSDSLRLAIGEETTPGTAPTGAYDLLRTTGEGLTYEVQTTTSDEMGGLNRGVKDSILVGATVTGTVNFELSKHDALETLMAAVHGNTFGGDPLTVPGAGADVVYDASDFRSFAIEKRFTLTDTPTYSYQLFEGCMVDTMSLSITPNEPITGSVGFIGQTLELPVADTGSSYVGAGTNPVMTAPLVTGIELLTPHGIDDSTGAPLGSPVPWSSDGCFMGLDLSWANNGRGIQCIGFLGNKETVLGRFEVTGTGSLYYAGDDPLEGLIDQTEYALQVTCTDSDGNSYDFLFPRLKLSAATVLASGTNTDVMTELTLQMLEYQGNSYAVSSMLTRSASVVLAAPAPTED